MDNIQDIKDIRNGKKLTEFETVSPVMVLAALSSRNAWNEVPEELKNRRFAKMAVTSDFRNIESVPEKDKIHCGAALASWNSRLTRKDLDEFLKIVNDLPDGLIDSMLRQEPSMRRFVKSRKKRDYTERPVENISPSYIKQVKPSTRKDLSRFYVDQDEFSTYDFAGAELGVVEEMNPEAFLARPVELQTIEDLQALLEIPDKFPTDFIARLQMPFRNEAYYRQNGDNERADLWAKRKVSWLNRQVCESIAEAHPEASVATPGYLKKEYIDNFWTWAKEADFDRRTMTEYYLLFPSELLSKEMLDDIEYDWQVMRHTPQFCVGTEASRKYLNKHPNDIFRLPEEYQSISKLLADGTKLDMTTLPLIKNEDVRNLLATAVGIELQKEA